MACHQFFYIWANGTSKQKLHLGMRMKQAILFKAVSIGKRLKGKRPFSSFYTQQLQSLEAKTANV